MSTIGVCIWTLLYTWLSGRRPWSQWRRYIVRYSLGCAAFFHCSSFTFFICDFVRPTSSGTEIPKSAHRQHPNDDNSIFYTVRQLQLSTWIRSTTSSIESLCWYSLPNAIKYSFTTWIFLTVNLISLTT